MASASTKKPTSVQTYRHDPSLVIRLEYDQTTSWQSVFLNGELRSSMHCPAGRRIDHEFKGHDSLADRCGYLSFWRVNFAVEKGTFRIRYQITRRDGKGDNDKWCWWDRNTEGDDWNGFPYYWPDEKAPICTSCLEELTCTTCSPPESVKCASCGSSFECGVCNPPDPPPPPACSKCNERLVCPECENATRHECEDCGATLTCEACHPCDEDPRPVYKLDRIRDTLVSMDADELKQSVINALRTQARASRAFGDVLDEIRSGLGD